MRLSITLALSLTLLSIGLIQETNGLCILFCDPTTEATPAPTSTPAPAATSSPPAAGTSSKASATTTAAASTTSPISSSTKSAVTTQPTTVQTSLTVTTASNTGTTLPTETAESAKKSTESSGSNTGVIIGSVCAFVAIIGAGFAYAFFSKTRRNSRGRLYENQPADFDSGNVYKREPFSRATPTPGEHISPVMANKQPWDVEQQQYNYGYNNTNNTMVSSPPIAAIPTHDTSYYNSPPAMTYGADPNAGYYNQPQPGYYQPAYGYEQPQYDPYSQPNMVQNTAVPANNYSAPYAYSNDVSPNPPPTTANTAYRQ
ncbi:hypothetical protein BDB01DRAFT_768974 [Pilobolus umbonatus]|nr:hypothetical protein BDB01DRAFT_768974 [Pilobolus umbonatus]